MSRTPSAPLPSRLLLLATRSLRARVVAGGLMRRGVVTDIAPCVEQMVSAAASGRPDAVLLVPERLGRPGGIDAIQRLRAASALPCVVVAARADSLADRVAALEAGADEVLHAGIPVPEAIARIRAVLRRARPPAPEPAAWRLLPSGRRLAPPSGPTERLTSAEYDLVAMLAGSAGAPLDREVISRGVFRRPWRPDDRAVDSLVKRLRRKMPEGSIQSVRGVGYALTLAIRTQPPSVEICAMHATVPVHCE
jgi:DNA-binding response OmpR family regulator